MQEQKERNSKNSIFKLLTRSVFVRVQNIQKKCHKILTIFSHFFHKTIVLLKRIRYIIYECD